MINFTLPLPPSKNKRTVRKGVKVRGKWINVPVLADEVLDYRGLVKMRLACYRGVFSDKEKIVLNCTWYRENKNSDVHNFHAELADAVAPALDLNDKYFLIRDIDFIDVKKGEGRVSVQMVRA